MEATIWKGGCWSAANAYLRPALRTGRLRLISGLARKVVFGGNRATGVEIVHRHHAESAFHPCDTARMGAIDDPDAVVDPELRVIGVDGLRVADSSIFPRITNGKQNGPSIMTGEKAADHILGRGMLAPTAQVSRVAPFPPNLLDRRRLFSFHPVG